MVRRRRRMAGVGGLVSLACTCIGVNLHAGAYSDAILADDPVAYWRLGEANATQPAANLGLLGQAGDGVGVYSDEAKLNQPSLVAGETDKSLLTGSGSRVTTPEFEKFDSVLGFGGSGVSVEFWTALEQVPSQFVNLVGDGVGGLNFNLMVYAGAGGFIRPHIQTDEGFSSIDSVRQLQPGEIVHVVSTWDQASGDFQLYLDGELADVVTSAGAVPRTGTPLNTLNPIYLGQDGREASPRAWLDEVAIYNYALDATSVSQHYGLGRGAPSPLPEPPKPFPDPGNLAGLPAGLVTYVDFDEASAPGNGGILDFAYDRQAANNGSFQGAATRTGGLVGKGAASFDGSPGAQVALGAGVDNSFSVTQGISVEALIKPEWSGDPGDYDEIFRKEDGGNRILFSFQNDAFGGGANPVVDPGPVLSFGLNTGGYQELDMPLDVDLAGLEGGNANSGTIWLTSPGGAIGPNDVILSDGKTHHAVATHDTASGEKSIWIDGVKRWSVDVGGAEITSGGGAIAYVGSVNGGENFTGVIDEFAFWNRALSGAEIADHFANVAAGKNYFGTGANPWDYDGDGQLSFADLELLRSAVQAGSNETRYDVTGDGQVSSADLANYVSSADKLNSYVGDANGDREFNSSDLVVVFQAGKFETGAAANWAEGDWDGTGQFSTGDLVFAFQGGGFEQGPRAAVAAQVPEPSTSCLLALSLLGLLRRRR